MNMVKILIFLKKDLNISVFYISRATQYHLFELFYMFSSLFQNFNNKTNFSTIPSTKYININTPNKGILCFLRIKAKNIKL